MVTIVDNGNFHLAVVASKPATSNGKTQSIEQHRKGDGNTYVAAVVIGGSNTLPFEPKL